MEGSEGKTRKSQSIIELSESIIGHLHYTANISEQSVIPFKISRVGLIYADT